MFGLFIACRRFGVFDEEKAFFYNYQGVQPSTETRDLLH